MVKFEPPLSVWVSFIENHVGFILPAAQHQWFVNAITAVAESEGVDTHTLYHRLTDDRVRQAVIDGVLITESRFFRDLHAITYIAELYGEVLHKRDKTPFSVTSVGCGTGQEVWSLAMALETKKKTFAAPSSSYQLTGIDVNQQSLKTAVAAKYAVCAQQQIPEVYHPYVHIDQQLVVNKGLKDGVNFELCNVFDEHAFCAFEQKYAKSSVLICQNMLIYFRKFDQRDILARIERLICPNGYLVLGVGEGLFWQPPNFRRITHPFVNLWQKLA